MKIIVLLLSLYTASAFACINSYDAELPEQMHRHKKSPAQMAATIQKLESENAKNGSVKTANDLAVAYIFSGNQQKAFELLTELEKRHPGLSRTAANLGTALELLGKNDEALHWIRQGIIRDKNEHQGTEWLHVKILEAKIAVAKDSGWLKKNTVTGIDFGNGASPAPPASLPLDASGKALSLQDIDKAIDYQLAERLKFVAPPDPYIADLYLTRGHIATLLKDKKASDYYATSKSFSEPPRRGRQSQ